MEDVCANKSSRTSQKKTPWESWPCSLCRKWSEWVALLFWVTLKWLVHVHGRPVFCSSKVVGSIHFLYQNYTRTMIVQKHVLYQKVILKQEPWILPWLTSKELWPLGRVCASLCLTCTSKCVANTVDNFSNRHDHLPSLSLLTQLRFYVAARWGIPVPRESSPVTTPGDSQDCFKSLSVLPLC